jgi:hypothetical protein
MKFKIASLLAAVAISINASAVQLAENPPETYTVVKGDTLWDISAMFLQQPWKWPEIWVVNEEIENPHLIYPGDVLRLVYRDGKPVIEIQRTVKLSPHIRVEPNNPITIVSLDVIQPFLNNARIFDSRDEFEVAPYVVQGARQNLIVGQMQELFARGEEGWAEDGINYGLYRGGKNWVDPVTGEYLGFEAIEIGTAKVQDKGVDIARLEVLSSNQEVRSADRVAEILPIGLETVYYPSAPNADIDGVILDVAGGVTQVGAMSVVMINNGERESLASGHVLEIWQRGETVRDPVSRKMVEMPAQRAGIAMIFQTYDKMSYAIVLEADRPLKVGDLVRTPQ